LPGCRELLSRLTFGQSEREHFGGQKSVETRVEGVTAGRIGIVGFAENGI
jgi:hypothetical protein